MTQNPTPPQTEKTTEKAPGKEDLKSEQPANASRAEWPGIAECTSTLGIRILLLLTRIGGDWILRPALLPVLAVYWLTNPRLRAAVSAYQIRADRKSGLFAALGVKGPGFWTGLMQLERFALAIREKFSALAGVNPAGLVVENDGMFRADPPAQGAVILTSHTGCQELLMTTAGGFTEHEIVILQHTAHARKFNELLGRAGAKPAKALFFEIGEALSPALVMELSEHASRGAYIILAGDRVPMGSDAAAPCPFLGDPARFPTGGALIALLLGIPLRMMVCTRPTVSKREFHVRFDSLCEAPPRARRGAREKWLAEMAALYAANLERALTRTPLSPLDWANFFDFWEEQKK
ncbi:hypothetical protein [Sutterella sp.]|uniref:hypothetical protein n=1 Tax=Sutterella sp. TaxID=1981025 RepID=UPI0026DFF6E9|nr:hypothetical protein [Sutterella sp.]MDO5531456.1 hypothetical protein [Sutterella sp.]